MDKDREAFEAWAKERYGSKDIRPNLLQKDSLGLYTAWELNADYQPWQAACEYMRLRDSSFEGIAGALQVELDYANDRIKELEKEISGWQPGG